MLLNFGDDYGLSGSYPLPEEIDPGVGHVRALFEEIDDHPEACRICVADLPTSRAHIASEKIFQDEKYWFGFVEWNPDLRF